MNARTVGPGKAAVSVRLIGLAQIVIHALAVGKAACVMSVPIIGAVPIATCAPLAWGVILAMSGIFNKFQPEGIIPVA